MTELRTGSIFRIQLCSGEIRHWQYMGVDDQERTWWRDMENGEEFAESSLMYAWQIIGAATPANHDQDTGEPE